MNPLEAISLDPISAQRIVLKSIMGEEVNLENPTNPLVTLTEAISTTTAGALQEFVQSEKYMFPALATNEEELYPHITNIDEQHLFASPSHTTLTMFIDLESIINSGVFENGAYKITIPKDSYVVIDEVRLTISNDVHVYINKKDGQFISFVEHEITTESTEATNIGTIYSTITTLEDNTQWVMFDIPVTQVNIIHTEAIATLGLDFHVEIPITDQYYYSVVEYLNPLTNEHTPVQKTYVESIYDPHTPTAYIQLLNDKVIYKIPKIYLDNIIRSNTIRISIYTTKGKIRMPLNKYKVEDFKFYLFKDKDTIHKAAAFNVNFIVKSNNILDGGVNRRVVRDMRKKFINRVTGNIDMPITEHQLVEKSRLDGFFLDKLKDTLYERVYVASKDINDFTTIDVPIYVYNANTKLFNIDDKQDSFIIEDDMFLVKPNTLFKNVNGMTSPVTQTEYDFVKNMDLASKIKYLNENNFLYNPFLYIIDNDLDIVTSRIYSINKPTVERLSIINKNKSLKENVNITGYNIVRENDRYYIFFKLSGNDAYELIKDNITIQLAVESTYGKRYFYSFVDTVLSESYIGREDDTVHIIQVDTDNLKIDNDEQMLLIPEDNNVNNISLFSHSDIVIFYNGTDLTSTGGVQTDATLYLNANEIPGRGDVIGLTRESVDITFATKLKYFWNRADSVFTENKYMKYEYDVPKIYPEDVYDDNLLPFDVSDTDGDGICDALEFNIIHHKGEIVYDANDNIVYEHRKGDIIYDEEDNPIIDKKYGLLKYVDILMMEYNYKASNKTIYLDHIEGIEDLLLDWSMYKMAELNNKTLDNTKILFRARRSSDLVISKTKNKYTKVLSPTVTLYYRQDSSAFKTDFDTVYKNIGMILNRYFSKPYINITDIEHSIIKSLDSSLLTVDVSDYLPDNPKIIDLETFSNRFEIKKSIDDIFQIRYDYKLNIEYI